MRVATINTNNLFSRWSFSADLPRTVADTALTTLHTTTTVGPAAAPMAVGPAAPAGDVVKIVLADGTELTGVLRTFRGNLVQGKEPKARAWIARRIAVLNADVLALQEVEDQDALDTFCQQDLAAAGIDYPYRVVVEGNDPRRIDVAICSKLPITRTSSWRYWPGPEGRVFSRDLLQAEIAAPDGRPLHVFVNHLKSNFITDEFRLSPTEIETAKQAITARRTDQADAIAAILRRLRLKKRIVVCGDMNDDPAAATLGTLTTAGLREHIQNATTIAGPNRAGTLIADAFAGEHPSMWTHRHRAHGTTSYGLYDQIWTSPDLAVTAAHVMRRTQITGDGTDHDPACIDLQL